MQKDIVIGSLVSLIGFVAMVSVIGFFQTTGKSSAGAPRAVKRPRTVGAGR